MGSKRDPQRGSSGSPLILIHQVHGAHWGGGGGQNQTPLERQQVGRSRPEGLIGMSGKSIGQIWCSSRFEGLRAPEEAGEEVF